MLGSMYRKWAGIKTFGVFNTIRKDKKTGEETKDTQYFITSLEKDATELIMHKRNHWQVENGLHRTLDVEFREDDSKKKIPIGRKRLMAGWDGDFMEKLILETINYLTIEN